MSRSRYLGYTFGMTIIGTAVSWVVSIVAHEAVRRSSLIWGPLDMNGQRRCRVAVRPAYNCLNWDGSIWDGWRTCRRGYTGGAPAGRLAAKWESVAVFVCRRKKKTHPCGLSNHDYSICTGWMNGAACKYNEKDRYNMILSHKSSANNDRKQIFYDKKIYEASIVFHPTNQDHIPLKNLIKTIQEESVWW